MSISPTLSVPVPALALVPAIVIEAIVIAVMLEGPATIEGHFLWVCSAPDIKPTYLPANCRD